MGYRNGKEVLPPALLTQVQQYAEGESIYIPRSHRQPKKADPEAGRRNAEICRKYAEGQSVRLLAEEYYLSPQSIYKILAKGRK